MAFHNLVGNKVYINDGAGKSSAKPKPKPAPVYNTQQTASGGNTPKGGSSGGKKNYVDSNISSGSGGGSYSSGGSVTVRGAGRPSTLGSLVNSAPKQEIPADAAAKNTLESLKNQYNEVLRKNYDYSAGKLKGETDDALRENYIRMRQSEAALPEQLARYGVTGGATETTLANLIADYEGKRNDIRKNQQDSLGELGMNLQNGIAESERSYGQQWLSHLLNLAEAEEDFKRQVALKQMD